jgi:hypothetical protein
MSLKSIADKFLGEVDGEEDVNVSSTDLFKEKIMSVIVNQNNKLNRLDFAQQYVIAELLRKVEMQELEVNDLLRFNKDLTLQKNDVLKTTLDLLKPSTNSGNPLMPPAIRQEENNPIEGLTSEERQAIHKLTQLLTLYGDKEVVTDATDVID